MEGLGKIPSRDIQFVADGFFDDIPFVLDGEIPFGSSNVDETYVVIAVLRLESPRSASRFTGIQDRNILRLFNPAQFLPDSSSDILPRGYG